MNRNNQSQVNVNTTEGDVQTPTRRYKKPFVMLTLGVLGALALSPLADGASATTGQASSDSKLAVTSLAPPTGMAWIQGVVTDQAGHGLDNVNVEVWPSDPAATAPVGSNLSYGGFPADGRHGHGAYRIEVPAGQPYRIVFSAVGGEEDGDDYRMQEYGRGLPVMVKSTGAHAAAKAGTTRNLGYTALVHQGQVRSTIKLSQPAKVKAGKRGSVRVSVTSPFVAPVTGKVTVKVAGKKATIVRLGQSGNGSATLHLPKLKAGKHKITASYAGTSTVLKSKAQPVKVTVVKKTRK
jgi:hypothetical protein